VAGQEEPGQRELDGAPLATKRSTKLRRSTWVNKAPKSLINVMLVEASEAARKPGEFFYLRTLFPATTEGTSHIHYWPSYWQYRILTQMYHHQAQKEQDWQEFEHAMKHNLTANSRMRTKTIQWFSASTIKSLQEDL
jgi:hypothetical protein